MIQNNKFIECNKQILKMLKYNNKNHLINTHPSELSPKFQPDGADSFEKANKMIQIAMDVGYNEFEWKHIRSTNEEFWLKVTLNKIKLNGTDTIYVRWRDIDHEKELELENEEQTKELMLLNENLEKKVKERTLELEKQTLKANNALKSKGEFLANMSHEIRTPLNAILGFVNFIKEETKNSKISEYINIIDKSTQILLHIIEDILDFSKIESGKLNIDIISFNAKEEFQIITHLFKGKCSQKDITLHVSIDNNLPLYIKSDPYRIKQIITNLLSNAVKFTSSGKNIFINFSYNDNLLEVSVKDEGKGIASNKLYHIFEAFNQEDNSTTREFGGTGLGLAISSEIVKLLGGELKVKSELGIGSEFYFKIPIEIGEKLNKSTNIPDNYNFKNQKILVVEDNKPNQILMKLILKKMGLSFEFANDGIEAVKMFKANKYSAVLMDENMPNMNGIEAVKHILKYETANNLPHTPIIALTANAIKGDREKFLKSGMDEYLTKPVNKKTLAEVLNKFLQS